MPKKFLYNDSTPQTISFRLDADAMRTLCQRARALEMSPHELARVYAIDGVSQSEERTVLRQAVEEVNHSVNRLRANLMLSIRAVLTSAGKVEESDAQQWVEKVFEES